jgi:hypothetical protein
MFTSQLSTWGWVVLCLDKVRFMWLGSLSLRRLACQTPTYLLGILVGWLSIASGEAAQRVSVLVWSSLSRPFSFLILMIRPPCHGLLHIFSWSFPHCLTFLSQRGFCSSLSLLSVKRNFFSRQVSLFRSYITRICCLSCRSHTFTGHLEPGLTFYVLLPSDYFENLNHGQPVSSFFQCRTALECIFSSVFWNGEPETCKRSE